MTTYTVFIVPHGLDFGSSCRCAPPRAGKELVQTVGECKTCTMSEIDLGKVGKEPVMGDVFYGLDFGKRLPEQVLQNSQRTLVQALMDGFRRHRHLLVQLRHLRRQLR